MQITSQTHKLEHYPIVDDFVQRFKLGKDFVVIADAGLMSTKNLKLLRDGNYKYIIGARIKKESGEIMEKIIATEHRNGMFNDIRYPDGDRLIRIYGMWNGRSVSQRELWMSDLCSTLPLEG